MATQFEFRLIGADMPEGQIDFDDAIALMQKLQELATKIGRVEVGAKHRGRPSDKVEQVAKLRLIGLLKGSTILQAERVEDKAQLDFDLDHEQGFDARFASIIEAIGGDERPADVSETIAETAADLVSVFRRIAPEWSSLRVVRYGSTSEPRCSGAKPGRLPSRNPPRRR